MRGAQAERDKDCHEQCKPTNDDSHGALLTLKLFPSIAARVSILLAVLYSEHRLVSGKGSPHYCEDLFVRSVILFGCVTLVVALRLGTRSCGRPNSYSAARTPVAHERRAVPYMC